MEKLRNVLLVFLLLCAVSSFAQVNLVGYEYWFNNDYSGVETVSITPASQHQLITNLDVSSLPEGVNVLNIRYQDEDGVYSSTVSKVFFKNTEQLTVDKDLLEYEYWFNNDYADVQIVPITPASQHQLITDLDVSLLPDGVNVLNIRYKDENGVYSSTISKVFFKNTEQLTVDKDLVEYEFWFNNDYADVQIVPITPASQHQLITDLDVSLLPDGVNVLSIRYRDENGVYSSTLSKVFYKQDHQLVDNKIIGYRYWFDDDFANAEHTSLQVPVKQLNVTEVIDMTQLPHGTHEVHYQFQDSLQVWSVVNTNVVEKTPFPIADFTYAANGFCDSTVVDFTDLSVDADTYLWDFGDGTTDTVADPSHTYIAPDTYLVMLTITDTITNTDSTLQLSITTLGAPDTSVTQNGVVLTANAIGVNYQWVDCDASYADVFGETDQTFTASENGNYAVVVSDNGCADTSACYAVLSVGMMENTFGHEISLYPNPSDGNFTIDLGRMYDDVEYTITDMTGAILLRESAQHAITLPVQFTETSGVYLIHISDRKHEAVLRAVIR